MEEEARIKQAAEWVLSFCGRVLLSSAALTLGLLLLRSGLLQIQKVQGARFRERIITPSAVATYGPFQNTYDSAHALE